jgi:hypothetical protein
MARLRRASLVVRSRVESGLAGDAALLRVRHRGLRGRVGASMPAATRLGAQAKGYAVTR